MIRGELFSAVLAREFGKPRPVVVVQSDLARVSQSIIVCPLTSDLIDAATPFRVRIARTPENGLKQNSDVMCDKITAADASRIGDRIGSLTNEQMQEVAERLIVILALAD